jgi:hypothetical protein
LSQVEFPRFLGELIPELLSFAVAASLRKREADQGKGKENVDAPHGVSEKIHCIGYKSNFFVRRAKNQECSVEVNFRIQSLLASENLLH